MCFSSLAKNLQVSFPEERNVPTTILCVYSGDRSDEVFYIHNHPSPLSSSGLALDLCFGVKASASTVFQGTLAA